MSVEFHAKHKRLLEAALDALGWPYEETRAGAYRVRDGMITVDTNAGRAEVGGYFQQELNTLKREYSKQALKRAAKLQGWQLKAKGQKGVLRR